MHEYMLLLVVLDQYIVLYMALVDESTCAVAVVVIKPIKLVYLLVQVMDQVSQDMVLK